MITEVTGDLLEADVDALVNAVNTAGVMGKGVALQFRRAFPANYAAYRRACDRSEVVLGKMFVFHNGQLTRPRFIVNFPTKQHWRSPSKLSDIESGLAELVRVIYEHGIKSIAVPALGCGNGGLEWEDVRPLIEHALGALPDVDVRLYPPQQAPTASEMREST
jgi:O-acetyl-ADP-ribose deacetylase (regulator of RNase III)